VADLYHRVGNTFRTAFDYLDDTGAVVTGLTQADFTFQLAKNGSHMAVAGLTLTEVSSVTEPGMYEVAVSATTGFPSAVGVYELVIFRTTVPYQRWTETIRVTNDGTGSGSLGTVGFTTATNNGRVTSAGVPVQDATVRFVDSNSLIIAQATTDASGLVGPIYFTTDGAYTMYVQKSGYTTVSGTVTISGSGTVATGPGTDLAIVAVTTSSTLTASSLWSYFKRCLRDRSGATADLYAQQGVDDALVMISQECEWSWFQTVYGLTVQPYYDTGTISITEGDATVTLVSGTFPTWAASADLYVNGQWYPVSSRTNGTTIELEQAWGMPSVSALSYAICQSRYTLPSDVQAIDGLRYDRAWGINPTPCSLATLTLLRSQYQYSLARPTMWAVSVDQIEFWPLPGVQQTLNLVYYRRPAALTSGAELADWDPVHVPLLRRAIEYQASLRGACVAGSTDQCLENYRLALTKAMQFDKQVTDHDNISVNRVAADDQWWRSGIDAS
jgi:hypothetical protein